MLADMDIIMSTDTRSLLSLLYLTSPALPIGAFAYSQGLEKAIELDWVSDRLTLEVWCHDALTQGLSQLDVPLVLLMQDALELQREDEVQKLNQRVFACRESLELYEEEKHLGASLTRLFRTQTLDQRLKFPFKQPENPSFLWAFAISALALEMDRTQTQISFLWSWLENQVAVACKAIPLGQTDAQKTLLSLKAVLPGCLIAEPAGLKVDDLYGSLPGQVLCSALHEAQYSRLFRS